MHDPKGRWVLKSSDTELPCGLIQAGGWRAPRPHSCSARPHLSVAAPAAEGQVPDDWGERRLLRTGGTRLTLAAMAACGLGGF